VQRLGSANPENSKTGWFIFSEHRVCAIQPDAAHEIVIALRNLLFLQNTIHWIKSITIQDREGDAQSYGHFKPISSRRF